MGRSITADDEVEVLDQAKAERGAPECIRMDNGPELIASAICDWCRLGGTGTIYIEPGSPWENPFVESFNARLRDELCNREIFHSVLEAKVLYVDWCDIHNNFRPHSSLGYRAPAMFAALLLCQWPSPELQTRSSPQTDVDSVAAEKPRAEKPQDALYRGVATLVAR